MERRQETDGEEEQDASPFAVPKPWITSARLESLTSPLHGVFHIADLEIPLLDVKYPRAESLDLSPLLLLPDLDRYSVGPLEDLDELPDGSAISSSESEYHSVVQDDIRDQDIWTTAGEFGWLKDEPKLHTWEAFANPNEVESVPLFISEAGAAAFDAALTREAQHSKGIVQAGSVLQSDALLRCLKFLAFGRPSILFPLDIEANTFYQAINDGRMSGYSLDSCQSLIEEFLDLGNAILALRRFTEEAYTSSKSFASKVALANVADIALSAIEKHLVKDAAAQTKTLLQLQAIVKQPKSVVYTFKEVVDHSKTTSSNEQLVSRVFEKLQDFADCGRDIDVVFQIFKRVSVPWLDRTMARIGLQDGLGHGSPKDAQQSDNEFLQTRNPSFLSDDCEQMIQDTQKCLRFVQEFHPNHPLTKPNSVGISAPKLEWSIDLEDLDRISNEAEQYHQSLVSALAEFDLKGSIVDSSTSRPDSEAHNSVDAVDWPALKREDALESSMANLSAEPNLLESDVPDELHNLITAQLIARTDPTLTFAGPRIASLCRFSLDPLLHTQHALLTTTTLRSILRDHDLHQQLTLLHAFYLCGSGVFASNLTRVLFSDDVEAAERSKGVVRTGLGTMGLRLGSGQRREWPPASCELTLALMNLLNQNWLSHAGTSETVVGSLRTSQTPFSESSDSTRVGSRAESLPGGLSFAIRTDVSQDEIEKILDPQSIYALDFLRLSYTPPPALSNLFTAQILEKYDRVFRTLLRMLRMQFVVGELYRETMRSSRKKRQRRPTAGASQTGERAEELLVHTFRHRATHFTTTLCSHFLNVGISKYWREMLEYIAALEDHVFSSPASAPAATPSPTTNDHHHAAQTHHPHRHPGGQPGKVNPLEFSLARLAQVHEATLSKITASLLLRSRQRKLGAALEAICGDVLRFAALLREQRRREDEAAAGWRAELESLYASFDARVVQFKDALREEGDKVEFSSTAARTVGADDDGAASLRGLWDRL